MRLFVAIELSDEARKAVAAFQKRIARAVAQGGAAVKWARPDQMHLTLAFIGEIDPSRAAAIAGAVEAPIAIEPFGVTFGGLGVFPERGAPRVLWLGASSGGAELARVQRMVADRLIHAGIVLESRPFQPHLTLARWKTSRAADARRALAADAGGVTARTVVDDVTLFESRSSSAGAAYTALARTSLAGASEQPLQ